MTKKIFWQNPYLTQLETRIVGVDGDDVTVEETIFYALSGGQESDRGTIGGRRVLQARKDGKDIVYTLEANHGLKPNDAVCIEIDWERRYKLMRLHLAAELVLELMYQNFASIEKVGAHIAQDKARIDFEWDRSIAETLPFIKEKALVIVKADKAIISAFSDEENQRRYWEVEGFARVPCGGTHLKKTSEIGDMRLKRKNPGKGKERIEIYVD
ncbi:MAG: alanyl-tRNA editing protein [Acidiferrobacterales bacterium]